MCTALAFLFVGSGSAYAQKKVHDSQKEKQWRSMETGPWDFEPGWYYYFLHKNYSGAETYWKWSGLQVRLPCPLQGTQVQRQDHHARRIAQEELQKEKSQESRGRACQGQGDARRGSRPCRRPQRRPCLLLLQGRLQPYAGSHHRGSYFLPYQKQGKARTRRSTSSSDRTTLSASPSPTPINKGIGNELENSKRQEAYVEYKKQMEERSSRVWPIL
jgi:hypothetical protein